MTGFIFIASKWVDRDYIIPMKKEEPHIEKLIDDTVREEDNDGWRLIRITNGIG